AGLAGPEACQGRARPPGRRVVQRARAAGVPVIYFAPAASHLLEDAATSGADVLGVCWRTPLDAARRRTGGRVALQGNLDPHALFGSREQVRERARGVLDAAGDAPGHSIR